MANTVVWFMYLLGLAHIVCDVVKFKRPVAVTFSQGIL